MNELPTADSGHNAEARKKIDAAVAARNLARASNNTRWNELINYVRHLQGWRPSYGFKYVDSCISGWSTEWFYHLPFPFISVEWFDICLQAPAKGRLLAPISHADEISKVVEDIGFEFEVRDSVLRIWGYLPKSYEDFPPR